MSQRKAVYAARFLRLGTGLTSIHVSVANATGRQAGQSGSCYGRSPVSSQARIGFESLWICQCRSCQCRDAVPPSGLLGFRASGLQVPLRTPCAAGSGSGRRRAACSESPADSVHETAVLVSASHEGSSCVLEGVHSQTHCLHRPWPLQRLRTFMPDINNLTRLVTPHISCHFLPLTERGPPASQAPSGSFMGFQPTV